jgi:hypothetical protein
VANKIKTRVDSTNPNKNKVSTLIGINKPQQFYQELLEFKIEHNGVEKPLNKLLEKVYDKLDSDAVLIKKLTNQIALLKKENTVYHEAITELDSRLSKLENLGNL